MIKNILNPKAWGRFSARHLCNAAARLAPNYRFHVPPGHFYSPLLDLESLDEQDSAFGDDGPGYWQHIDLRREQQFAYYETLLNTLPLPEFPESKTDSLRYYTDNGMFCFSDAFTLASVIQKEQPRKIIEVGSGFSSAVMLDTLDKTEMTTQVTFIEPYPDRLNALLRAHDRSRSSTLEQPLQNVPLTLFDELEKQDILFIDSTHVAKVGSDVAFLLLRVLPRLKPGVIIHIHDIFYPNSYPIQWIRDGWAWNESLFLRAFLVGNRDYKIIAFNSFAGFSFPELFEKPLPRFLEDTGGSIWLRKS